MTSNSKTRTVPTHRYRLFGLAVQSDVALPELRVDEVQAAEPDVTIRLGPIPEPVETLVPMGEYVDIAPSEFRLDVPEVARFLVRGGREIYLSPAPGASAEDIRAYLLGSVFGGLVHQAGLLPLHASAIADDGRAAAFLGRSGAGKSTLAHRLSERGHGLLSDDVCVVHGGQEPRVWPGIRQFKLWASSLSAAGESRQGLTPVLMREDKFLLPTRRLAEDRPHRLELVYVLGRHDGEETRITPLKGIEAISALVSNTYRGVALRKMERSAWHLQRCAEIARHCRIFSLDIAWGFDRADAVYERLEEHMQGQLGSGT